MQQGIYKLSNPAELDTPVMLTYPHIVHRNIDEIIELNEPKINIMNKIENRGLIKESIENRGDLYVQIIYHNI